MRIILKRIKIFTATLCSLLLFLSSSNIAFGLEDEYDISEKTFYDELTIMLNLSNDYVTYIQTDSIVDENNVIENTVSTNRLIVSTDSNRDLSRNYGAISKIEGYNNWHIFQYKTYEEASLAYEAFSQDNSVDYVEFDELLDPADIELTPSENDNYTPLSWGAEYTQSLSANNAILASGLSLPEVVVAVIDTGIDSNHSFFNTDQNNPRVLKGNMTNDNVPRTDHGTHIAGIIADNTLPNVKIKSYNLAYYANQIIYETTITLATEILFAVNDSVDVINLSLHVNKIESQEAIKSAIRNAINNNIPVVASAGNYTTDASLLFPANMPEVITVAAISEEGKPASFSNYGSCVDIAAPGVDINSTIPGDVYSNNNYAKNNGTSMAAPFVSAAVAMIKSIYPNLTANEIKDKIVQSAYVPRNWNRLYGNGILNFENIIKNDRLTSPTINLSKIGATIGSSSSKVTVYYTTDGTAPIIGESKIYSSEIIDTSNIDTIRAIAYQEGHLPSYVVAKHMKFTVSNCSVRYKGTAELPYIPDSKIIRCYSSSPEIVTVDYNGQITGLTIGKTTVTVYYENNQVGTYEVSVEYAWWQWFIRIFFFGFLWY